MTAALHLLTAWFLLLHTRMQYLLMSFNLLVRSHWVGIHLPGAPCLDEVWRTGIRFDHAHHWLCGTYQEDCGHEWSPEGEARTHQVLNCQYIRIPSTMKLCARNATYILTNWKQECETEIACKLFDFLKVKFQTLGFGIGYVTSTKSCILKGHGIVIFIISFPVPSYFASKYAYHDMVWVLVRVSVCFWVAVRNEWHLPLWSAGDDASTSTFYDISTSPPVHPIHWITRIFFVLDSCCTR